MYSKLRPVVELLLLGAAIFCSWVFALNRVIVNWQDSLAKSSIQLGLGLALTVAGWRAWRRQPRWAFGAAAAALVVFAFGECRRAWLRESYGVTVGGVQTGSLWQPVTTTALALDRYTVSAGKLPRERLRVVHLSDLHVNESLGRDYYARVSSEVRALEPDLIVMTGDFISKLDRLPLLQAWLKDAPRAPGGTYAVLGNHEYWTEQPELARGALDHAGVRVLTGACEVSAGVRVCGTDAPWGPALPPTALTDRSAFTLVLSHTPDNVYEAADAGAEAVFAGHTHGGQFRLPLLGAVIVPSRYGRRFDRGHFVIGQTNLFVSPGLGADAPALRLWCRPAIVVVDFVRR
jgi:predicted MPP superfamily phosphohydrolase